jgi:hypothetical protein
MVLNFETVSKIVELLFAFIGLLFIIFGWVIPYKQSIKSTEKQHKFEQKLLCAQWEKELLDKQISEFYGPIAELLREQDMRRALIQYQIGRKSIFHEGQDKISDLTEQEQKIWMHFIDTYSLPTQTRIIEIFQTHQHLIYQSDTPECFRPFMEYVLGWELLDNQKRNSVPNYYEYHYSYNYPIEFNRYIENTLMILLNRQKELMEICL